MPFGNKTSTLHKFYKSHSINIWIPKSNKVGTGPMENHTRFLEIINRLQDHPWWFLERRGGDVGMNFSRRSVRWLFCNPDFRQHFIAYFSSTLGCQDFIDFDQVYRQSSITMGNTRFLN